MYVHKPRVKQKNAADFHFSRKGLGAKMRAPAGLKVLLSEDLKRYSPAVLFVSGDRIQIFPPTHRMLNRKCDTLFL